MNFGECKKRSLLLAFNYSLAGTAIPDTYNNQADYAAMIPGLVNEAQMDIATTVRRIPARKELSRMHCHAGDQADIYSLPRDCYLPMTGGLIDDRCPERYFGYRFMGRQKIAVPHRTGEHLTLEYFRYPRKLPDSAPDSARLDNDSAVHECLPYYVAYGLLLYDDAYRAQVFKNEYELRKARLREPLWLEPGAIHNYYDWR